MSEQETAKPGRRRWFGKSAAIAAVLFVVGRIALEPLRDEAHFDDHGMEAFSAVETYMLRKNPVPAKIAFFGSSQSLWAILPESMAAEWGEDPDQVRNLATEGGTPFDMWNLIRRNEDKLQGLRVAVVEVNPFVLRRGLDGDPRVSIDIAQHGTISERLMLANRVDRMKQLAEWVLPLMSVRRSLQSAFLDAVDPDPGLPIYPWPQQRTFPAIGWRVDGNLHRKKERQDLAPALAAKRMVGAWRCSKLQDHSFRELLAWFAQHGVKVIFHELPVHPEVVKAISKDPALVQGQKDYLAYLGTLEPQPSAKILTLDPAGCGIAAEQFADRTHVNELGASAYSSYLAAKLKTLLPRTP